MAYETLSREVVFRGRIFNVRRDRVRLPDGRTTALDIVEHEGAVTLVPLDDQARVWFIRQYRHAAGGAILELPAGTLRPGEPIEACARRELREEIGMDAGRLTYLGACYLAPGYSTERNRLYLAQDLTRAPLAGDADEVIEVMPLPLDEAMSMAVRGRIEDAKSLAGLFLALAHLRRLGG